MRQMAITLILLTTGLSVAADKYDAFVWSAAEIGGKVYDKTAILVPIEIEGISKKLYGQLDTGSDATILYGKCLRKHEIPVDSAGNEAPPFRWYGHNEKTGPLEKAAIIDWAMDSDIENQSDTPDSYIIGTIGLDKVASRILVLDFPANRYAVVDDTALLPDVIPTAIDYVDGVVSYNKLYIDVALGEDTIPAVRYDSGSSISVLVLPRDWWLWATGFEGDESEVLKDSVLSWGKFVSILVAPSKYDMRFGNFRVKNPMISFVDWTDPALATTKLLGNAAFYDSCVVVVDCIREKFGVGRR